jgi:RHS repeat-associated protein
MKTTLIRFFKRLAAVALGLGLASQALAVNDAAFVSQNVPSVMVPGQLYSVSVTMQNTGDTTWDAASLYRLGSQNPQDNSTWGGARVELPGPVAPGAIVTLTFDVTAPATVGTYNFQWRMVEDLVEWFGAFSTNVAVRDGINDALFVSQSVPSVMAPGQTYAVSVTMQNTGNVTWTSANLYRLGAQNPQDNNIWGVVRVELPGPVAPGASVTFNFNVTAPGTVGTYNFQWRMVEDNVEWFGDYSTNVAVKDGVNDALFVSQSVPGIMMPGQTYAVSVTMQNTGNVAWSPANLYRLGSQNPQDNNTWGVVRVELPGPVAPGASVTFNFTVTAPNTVGTYNFQWRMVEDAVEWFGDYSANVAVKDGVNDAVFVSQTVPSVMTPGRSYPVTVTMQNTGNTTWMAASLYRLGSQNPQDNSTWGLQRVELPNAVAPGASVTFSFNVTAPATPGPYNFQWRMVEDLVEWFGAYSPNVAVKDGVNDAAFVSQSVPATFTPGQTRPVTVTMQNTGTTTWSAANLYRLGAQNPQDNTTWGTARVELPGPVAPGASATFSFNVTAPATVGSYNFQWRMVQDNVEWFGAYTANLSISVQGQAAAQIFYIHPDHLGTPREITRATDNQIVWRWDNTEAFGDSQPNEDPSGLGTFAYNLRLPGQYYDVESGLSYNYFRDFDPSLGRYIQSDLIGLRAGLNTYAYVEGSPLWLIDEFGLASKPPICSGKDCPDPPFCPTPEGPRPCPQPGPSKPGKDKSPKGDECKSQPLLETCIECCSIRNRFNPGNISPCIIKNCTDPRGITSNPEPKMCRAP